MEKSNISNDLIKIRSEIQSVPIDHVSLEYCKSLLGRLKYIDPYFPPSDESIYGTNPNKHWKIVWKRPKEFLKGKIDIFEDGIENSDINQGKLGDCWLMCSICALANRPEYITSIFLNKKYCEQEFYRLRLCKDGEWQNVTVDDLIPCEAHNGPIFSKAHGSEIWVLILEKAYAKLNGSYFALKGGMAQESFEDLTGKPAFSYYFEKLAEKIKSGEFWREILQWKQANHCLLAATGAEAKESEGIVSSHYYTIINVADCLGYKLLNLRNPWGSFEWKGAWSDNSAEWTPEMIQMLQPVFDPEDGAFWMSFEDFLKNFQRIVVGKLDFPYEKRLKTLIVNNVIFGASPLEYFILKVFEPTTVVVEFHQEDERSVGVETYRPYLDLGIAVIMQGRGFFDYSKVSQQHRESQIELQLEPGTYLVVPICGGSAFKPEGDIPQSPLLTPTGEFHPIFQSVLKDIFRKYDRDMDQIMDCTQFLDFMSRIGIHYDEKRFYSLIVNKYTSTDAGLALQGFYEIFYVAIEQYGEKTVRNWLTFLGYDENMYSIESRSIVASFHSTCPVEVEFATITPDFLLYTWVEIAKNRGKLDMTLENVSLYTIKHHEGISILLSNSGRDSVVTIDLSESENLNYSIRGNTVLEVEVPGNSWIIAEHLQCKKDATTFSYSISARLGY
jgi:calpain-15